MIRSNFDPRTANKAHQDTILASGVLPSGVTGPFDHAWGYLDKPGEMEIHKHAKDEIYFFFKGNGFVMVGDEKQAVAPGDVIFIPPNELHTVINEEHAELLWAALWWDVKAP